MITIRPFKDSDWNSVWQILKPVFRAGETYAFDPEITESESRKIWIEMPRITFVALDDSETICGTYYIKANFQGPGSHVCNCGYVVSEYSRGKGLAARMCEHSQQEAVNLGFLAMQFNSVVSTNVDAVHLWKKLGYRVVGTLPGMFHHPKHGYVDALVMFKHLVPFQS